MCFYPESGRHITDKVKIVLYTSNYGTKKN